jgi:hypothetical protein
VGKKRCVVSAVHCSDDPLFLCARGKREEEEVDATRRRKEMRRTWDPGNGWRGCSRCQRDCVCCC